MAASNHHDALSNLPVYPYATSDAIDIAHESERISALMNDDVFQLWLTQDLHTNLELDSIFDGGIDHGFASDDSIFGSGDGGFADDEAVSIDDSEIMSIDGHENHFENYYHTDLAYDHLDLDDDHLDHGYSLLELWLITDGVRVVDAELDYYYSYGHDNVEDHLEA